MNSALRLIICFFTALATTATLGLAAPRDRNQDDVLLFVNGQPVFKEDYRINLAALETRLKSIKASPLRFAILQNLATSQAIVGEVLRTASANIQISEEELNSTIDSLRGKVSLDDFKRNLAAQGVDWDELLQRIKEQLRFNQYFKQLEQVEVTDEEISFVHKNHLSFKDKTLEPRLELIKTFIRNAKASAELERWVQYTSRQLELTYPEGSTQKFDNPVVASIEGINIHLNDLSLRAYYSYDFSFYGYSSTNGYDSWFKKGKAAILEKMIDEEAAALLANRAGLPMIGDAITMLNLMYNYQRSKVSISNQEIETYYRQNKKKYMLPELAVVSRFAFKDAKKANGFRNSMLAGAKDMLKTARQYTDIPISAYFKFSRTISSSWKLDLDAVFAKDLRKVRDGRISKVFVDRYKDNVVYIVHEIVPAQPKPLSEVKKPIISILTDTRMKTWLPNARKNISINNKYLTVLKEIEQRTTNPNNKITPSN